MVKRYTLYKVCLLLLALAALLRDPLGHLLPGQRRAALRASAPGAGRIRHCLPV